MRLTGAIAGAMLAAGVAAAQAPPTSASLQALKAAAASGAPQAEYLVGEAYRTGNGTLKDPNQAILWYKKAAAQGHQPSADALGLLLFVNGDRKTAVPLLQAAAARGNPRALYILGTAHFNGDTVPRDRPLAYAELSRAAASLPAAQRNLDLVAHYLTPEELARARTLAAQPTLPAATAGAVPPAAAVASARPPSPVRLATATVPASAAPVSPAATPAPLRIVPAAVAQADPPPPTARPRPRPLAVPALSLARPPIARVPVPTAGAATPAPGGRWRIQLGAYSSASRAELQWQILARRPTLAALHHLVTPAGALFRLQAEGFRSATDAGQACREVSASGQACFPVAP